MEYILIFGKVILLALTIIFSYLLLAFILPLFSINKRFIPSKDGIKIFIISNGIHADFLIPAVNVAFDWRQFLDFSVYQNESETPRYLGVGWGDRGFYLDTPTWAELKFKTAVNALLWPSPTVMHITAYDDFPEGYNFVEEIDLNEEQYLNLCAFIARKFRKDDYGKIELLPNVGYTPHDNFYEAYGAYHAFNTCNYWISRGLKESGVRTPLWTPHDRGIFYHLKKIGSEDI